jgi:hypothetical protein
VVKLPRQRQQQQQTTQQPQQQRETGNSGSLQQSSGEQQGDSVEAAAEAAAAAAMLVEQEALDADEDPFAEQPVLPVTWLSYKGQGSSSFLVWVAGQGAGQVGNCTAAAAVAAAAESSHLCNSCLMACTACS